MKSRPLIEVLFILALFVMAAIPLSRLTGTTPESHAGYVPSRVEAVDARPAATVPVHIRLVFSHAPVRCELALPDGNPLWRFDNAEGETHAEADIALDIPDHGGLELLLIVEWPSGEGNRAVSVILEPDGMDGVEVTVWGDGRLEKLLTFQL